MEMSINFEEKSEIRKHQSTCSQTSQRNSSSLTGMGKETHRLRTDAHFLQLAFRADVLPVCLGLFGLS
jgi:hypothetical protein